MSKIIEAVNISKQFAGNRITACRNVNFKLEEREIHAVAGENGSGKSTLMHILSGLIKPDSGKIYLKNSETAFKSPSDAVKKGIGMIHQIPGIIPGFSVLENIIIGCEKMKLSGIDKKSHICEIEDLKTMYGIDIDLNSVPVFPRAKQYTLLLSLIYHKAEVIILDEPASSFTDIETADFFNSMHALKKNGKTIVLITHKVKSALSLADRITVFSRGENRGTFKTAETDADKIASLIIGENRKKEANYSFSEQKNHNNSNRKTILQVSEAALEGCKSSGITFSAKEGEILSFTGIRDNNLDLLEDLLGGFRKLSKGEILFTGKDITGMDIKSLREKGIVYIPSDRIGRGTSMLTTVENNIALTHIDDFSDKGFISRTKLKAFFESGRSRYRINAFYGQPLWQLSGGNIQKIILFRELYKADQLLIICEPAWNLDFTSRDMIYDELIRLKEKGVSIIVISTDIQEVIKLSDRVIVMYQGKTEEMLEGGAINSSNIGRIMLGLDKVKGESSCPV